MGERMVRLRHAAGLSQSQVADLAGVPIASLRNWEHDRREPSISTAARLAQAIGCSLDELAGLTGDPPAEGEDKGKGKKGK